MHMRRLVPALLLVLLTGCGSDQVGQPDTGFPYLEPEQVEGPICPKAFDESAETPWVPAPPSTETPGRLVLDADPVEAVVCRYIPEGEVEQRELTDGLDRIRHDLLLPQKLSDQTRACTLIGGTPVPHLMHLRYADGDGWVSATEEPNSCTDSGNGEFVSASYLGGQLAASYDAGAWVAAPEPRGCTGDGRGRLGQERTLVPTGWSSLHVCRPAGSGLDQPREVPRASADQVAALLQEVETEPGSGGCSGTLRTTYDLLFSWPDGPPVHVSYLPGCEPSMRNGSLDGAPTAAQGERLESLLAAP